MISHVVIIVIMVIMVMVIVMVIVRIIMMDGRRSNISLQARTKINPRRQTMTTLIQTSLCLLLQLQRQQILSNQGITTHIVRSLTLCILDTNYMGGFWNFRHQPLDNLNGFVCVCVCHAIVAVVARSSGIMQGGISLIIKGIDAGSMLLY